MGRNADKRWRGGAGAGAGAGKEEKEESAVSDRADQETTLVWRHLLPLDETAGAFVGPDLEFDPGAVQAFSFIFSPFSVSYRIHSARQWKIQTQKVPPETYGNLQKKNILNCERKLKNISSGTYPHSTGAHKVSRTTTRFMFCVKKIKHTTCKQTFILASKLIVFTYATQ
jgi:hypothetical protein